MSTQSESAGDRSLLGCYHFSFCTGTASRAAPRPASSHPWTTWWPRCHAGICRSSPRWMLALALPCKAWARSWPLEEPLRTGRAMDVPSDKHQGTQNEERRQPKNSKEPKSTETNKTQPLARSSSLLVGALGVV